MKIIKNNERACSATIHNAKAILDFEIQNGCTYLDIIRDIIDKKYSVIKKSTIMNILAQILISEDNTMITKTICASKENKTELKTYLFENNLTFDQIARKDQYALFKHFKLTDLSFLNCFSSDSKILDDFILDNAQSYKTILTDNWKDSASTENKINYILRFANEFADTREYGYWELISVDDTF